MRDGYGRPPKDERPKYTTLNTSEGPMRHGNEPTCAPDEEDDDGIPTEEEGEIIILIGELIHQTEEARLHSQSAQAV